MKYDSEARHKKYLKNRDKYKSVSLDYKLRNKEYLLDKNRTYQKIKHKKFREFLNIYKSSNPCVLCGEFFKSEAMDFHHLGDKRFVIASSSNRKMEDIMKEIKKCELLCANCHRIHTNNVSKQRVFYKKKHKILNFIQSFKNTECTDCNKKFPPFCMDFDHVRGEKVFSIGDFTSKFYSSASEELIKVEIDKCDIVCACCHRIRTANREYK